MELIIPEDSQLLVGVVTMSNITITDNDGMYYCTVMFMPTHILHSCEKCVEHLLAQAVNLH